MFVGEFRQDIRTIIPTIVKLGNDIYPAVCEAATELLSKLAVQSMC